MTSRGRQLRWATAGALALVVLLAATVTPAQAASVTVLRPTGNTEAVNLDPLFANPDVRDRTYTVRGEDGSTTTRTVTGVSLAAVLDQAKADIDQFRYAQVGNGSAKAVTFNEDQALRKAPDWSGDGPPVFYLAPDGSLHFLRPSAGADDVNATDELVAPIGMTIALRRTIELRIAVVAEPAKPKAGERVTFTALVENAGAGETATVTWVFRDDNRTAEGVEAQHTFRKRGTFSVIATARTKGNPNGVSEVVTIQVGGPAEPKQEKEPEPEAGTVTSSGNGGTADGTGTGAGSGSGAIGAGDAAAAAPPPAVSAPPAEEKQPERKKAKPKQAEDPPPTEIPGEVSGELLVADMVPVAAPAPARVAPDAPEANDADGGPFGVPAAGWTGVGVGVALAAGFALDRRRGRLA